MNDNKSVTRKLETLKIVPIFSGLGIKDLEKIANVAFQRSYTKEQVVLFEDEGGQTLFIVMTGQVKISRISEDGREVILAVMAEGDFFGELSLLDGQSRSANVVCTKDAEMLLINRDDFLNLLSEFPQIAIQLLRELASRMRKSDSQIKNLSLKNSTGKVAGTIARLAEDIGIPNNGSTIEIPNLPTQQDLANMSGTSRETISRVLQRFINDGYVSKDGNKLVIRDFEKFKKDLV
ncbi:Crp/Fnr family transcriptional regulator [bacterium]|nr:Crp/Fnr family transcriptional regulator [bacterium]NUN44110.1 Crp/Fnr family transcriptional regulator [bacterium]HMV27579.1 Crp/Fnr family transcriptional regulator [bacterium]HMW33775.1 Crp/Fnr family transcriptional regulator [bacterium]HMW35341.1 Crp/Fnr family transcriptional regulator [bacterium]